MSITVLQAASAQVANSGTDSSVTVTLPNPTRAGNTLVAIGADNASTVPVAATPFQDNASNAWQVAVPTNDGFLVSGNRTTQYFSSLTSGRSGHTVTYTVTGLYFPSIAVAELGGVIDTPLDQTASNLGHSVNLNPRRSTPTGATSFADEIAVAGMTHNGVLSQVISSNNGFTIQTKQENTSKMPVVLSTLVVSDFATAEEAYNLTPNSGCDWVIVLATYVAAPGATVTYGYASS